MVVLLALKYGKVAFSTSRLTVQIKQDEIAELDFSAAGCYLAYDDNYDTLWLMRCNASRDRRGDS